MNEIMNNFGSIIIDGQVYIKGVKVPNPPTNCRCITITNGKVYIDGYEYKKGKWRRTLKALWHLWF